MVKLTVYDQNVDLFDSRGNPTADFFFNRRSSTTPPNITTVAPGSLADLNLKMDAMKNLLTALNNLVVAEDVKIQALAVQMQDISNSLTILKSIITRTPA